MPRDQALDPALFSLHGDRVLPPQASLGPEQHYLRLDQVLAFLRAAWADGIVAGRMSALAELREAQLSYPMPGVAEALGGLERRLQRPAGAEIAPIYEQTLLSLISGPDSPSP